MCSRIAQFAVVCKAKLNRMQLRETVCTLVISVYYGQRKGREKGREERARCLYIIHRVNYSISRRLLVRFAAASRRLL